MNGKTGVFAIEAIVPKLIIFISVSVPECPLTMSKGAIMTI